MDLLDAQQAQLRMISASKWKHDNHVAVGKARVVRAMFSDRKKQLLAKYMPALGSAVKGEHDARRNAAYIHELEGPQGLVEQAEAAEVIIAKAEANDSSFEAARSYLAYNRESLRQLEG